MSTRTLFVSAAFFERLAAPQHEPPSDDASEDAGALYTRVRHLFGRLPPAEADALELRELGKTEQEIASIFGVSQQAISRRVARAQARLRFLAQWPGTDLDISQVRAALAPHFEAAEVSAVVCYLQTTSQSATARLGGETQPTARRRLSQVISDLERLAPQHPMLATVLAALKSAWERPRILGF